ncbi:hypothetical protein [Mycobacterium helveticum]|uniref:Uncharacterized protein n=1 Tax=Mycobacterium helveticum TaxID=2592811 RepID=A0A557WWK7_9MYCO|nr:hypothetical protein [Mycobacterium helveticum]TVS76997.1 hypothetical protein FPZ46_26595 [Mycobacterium helveticum]TVS77648.1 hypothetical protein FPZ47_26610 [Mycobacterium helveticum]
MSDVISTWIANGGSTSGFGPLTAAVLQTQNVSQASQAGIVASQAFLRALIDAATNGGTV